MMAKKKALIETPVEIQRVMDSLRLNEEERDEINQRRQQALNELAESIGRPGALKKLLPVLDKQAVDEHGVSFEVLANETGGRDLMRAIRKLGRESDLSEEAKKIGLLDAVCKLGYAPPSRIVERAKSDSLVLRPANGAGADTTLLERSIRVHEKTYLVEIEKGKRRLRNIENNIARADGSDGVSQAREAEAEELVSKILDLYNRSELPPHNRTSMIAIKLNVTRQWVGKVLAKNGVKK